MANWEELPQDVLGLIAGRLAIKDYLAFGGVCTSWRSPAAKEAYKAKLKDPWVMIYEGNQTIQFFSSSRGRINREMVPGSRCETLSTPGWILVSKCGNRSRIFNPLSGVTIKLPTLGKLHRKSLPDLKLHWLNMTSCYPPGITRIALSSSPSSSRSYTVMIYVHWQCGQRQFAFHRYGEDAWTVVSPSAHLPWSNVLQLIYYDGLFVALDVNNRIMTLNERERRMELRLVLRQNFYGRWCLVECSGSLLGAQNIWGDKGRGFRVFKVDLEKGAQEEVKSLGNTSLFLNDDLSSAFSVEFTDESCLPKFKPNHIYFIENGKKKSYSMDERKVRKDFHGTRRHYYAAKWFQPDF